MKTLKDEIVEWLRLAAELEEKYLDTTSMGRLPKDCAVSEWLYRAAKVESARCEECSIKDELLKEMAEALEEIVRCLSHGLQDCRASITAKKMLQKYHE